MARGIAFGLGDGIGNVIKKYFETNPCPPRNLMVDRVDVIEVEGQTFIDLLKAIYRSNATDFVLVVHGQLSGQGLFLDLGPGGPFCKGKHLQTLMDIDAGRTVSAGSRAELNLSDESVKTLIDLMKKIRSKRLRVIEWRSCDLGANPTVLKQFHQFFGASITGAPKGLNIFGLSPVSILPFDKIPGKYHQGFTAYYYPDKWKPTVINYLKLNPVNSWPEEGLIFAENRQAVQDWVTTYINPAGRVGSVIAVHAMFKVFDENNPLANPEVFLPQSTDYAKNILYAEDAGGFPITYSPYF